MKIVITGAKGFLGSHLFNDFVDKGHEVKVVSYRADKDQQLYSAIVDSIREFKPDLIINAGASQQGKDDPDAIRELLLSNVALPAYLAWAIKTFLPKCLLITFGSSWQFDDNNEQYPFNAYAATKSAAEDLLEHYGLDGVRIASLRLYDTYGPNDARKKLVNLIADAMNKKEKLDMSGGEQQIDLIHISDVISAVEQTIRLLMNHERGCLLKYAVRSGDPVQVRQLAKIMAEIKNLNVTEMVNLGFYPYRKRERFVLNNQQETVPGWRVKTSLGVGLCELMELRRQTD